MLHIKRSAICGSVFAVVLLWGTLAHGQTTAGTILGAVSDESGARLPGVTVTITHLDTGIVRSVTTDESGRYRAPALGLGNYDVKAELTGFRTEVLLKVRIQCRKTPPGEELVSGGELCSISPPPEVIRKHDRDECGRRFLASQVIVFIVIRGNRERETRIGQNAVTDLVRQQSLRSETAIAAEQDE